MPKQFRNPFYVLLLLVGLAFLLTACSYAVVAVRGIDAPLPEASDLELRESPSAHRFLDLVDTYGFFALMTELALLALMTVAAIATDQYWMGRSQTPGPISNLDTPSDVDRPIDKEQG